VTISGVRARWYIGRRIYRRDVLLRKRDHRIIDTGSGQNDDGRHACIAHRDVGTNSTRLCPLENRGIVHIRAFSADGHCAAAAVLDHLLLESDGCGHLGSLCLTLESEQGRIDAAIAADHAVCLLLNVADTF